tara:strand:- start:121 stop:276 length:156 start_codon:yes stop_codon:yes gene_type:complete
MKLKKMYSNDGEMHLVEPDSQAEHERVELGWTDKAPKTQIKKKTAMETKAE